MARPSRPLLSRARVVAAAIQIIDSDGLAACSLPRLAREFGVRAPSLYHHFSDRAEIMAEVSRAVVQETVIPRQVNYTDWVEWFVALALNFRRSILRHPNAAPILLEHVPRDVLSPLYDSAARYLTDNGVPTRLHVLILDGLESLTLGAALTQATKAPAARAETFPRFDRESEWALAEAVDANRWTTTQDLFAQSVRSFLRGTVDLTADAVPDSRRPTGRVRSSAPG